MEGHAPPWLPPLTPLNEGSRLLPASEVSQIPDSLTQNPMIPGQIPAQSREGVKQLLPSQDNGWILRSGPPEVIPVEMEADSADPLVATAPPHLQDAGEMPSMEVLEGPLCLPSPPQQRSGIGGYRVRRRLGGTAESGGI